MNAQANEIAKIEYGLNNHKQKQGSDCCHLKNETIKGTFELRRRKLNMFCFANWILKRK